MGGREEIVVVHEKSEPVGDIINVEVRIPVRVGDYSRREGRYVFITIFERMWQDRRLWM